MPKKRMEDRWEYVDAVVRGEREKGWNGEKYTKSAQVDYIHA
jgi:hypothetical protein